MDTRTDETGPSQPQREKRMAIRGAIIGSVVGAIVFGLLFYIPTFYMNLKYEWLFPVVGVIMGIIHGGSAGPLVGLRFSKKWGTRRTLPH